MEKSNTFGVVVESLIIIISHKFFSPVRMEPTLPSSPADLWDVLSGPGNRVQTFFLD